MSRLLWNNGWRQAWRQGDGLRGCSCLVDRGQLGPGPPVGAMVDED